MVDRRRVAVVGSGVAGLTAAYVLQRECDVTLFEADERLGGHAHTHELADGSGTPVRVDSGFLVHNARTYPTLLRLFAELGVATQDSDMSMSIRCDGCGLEYAGARGAGGLFPTFATATNPRYLLLLGEVVRFHRRARALLARGEDSDGNETLGEFVRRGRFGRYFCAHFLTPLVSAVWSCPPELVGRYPARYLFAFLRNHGMLTVTGSPRWRTVVGGSVSYVQRAVKALSAVHTSTPVRSLTRDGRGVEIRDGDGQLHRFAAAVIATHPDQALALLARPTQAERVTLGAFRYSRNPAVLHTDTSVLPHAERASASWNYALPACNAPASAVRVSYDLNRLQRLHTSTRYLVTLNEHESIRPERVIERMVYRHPIYTPESVAAQAGLGALNDGVLAFAGAYHGWGFHEDGCVAGVRAAASLGVPW